MRMASAYVCILCNVRKTKDYVKENKSDVLFPLSFSACGAAGGLDVMDSLSLSCSTIRMHHGRIVRF
jgi:hypothetical protein